MATNIDWDADIDDAVEALYDANAEDLSNLGMPTWIVDTGDEFTTNCYDYIEAYPELIYRILGLPDEVDLSEVMPDITDSDKDTEEIEEDVILYLEYEYGFGVRYFKLIIDDRSSS